MIYKNLLILLYCVLFSQCSETSNPVIVQSNHLVSSSISFGSNQTLDIVTWNVEHFPKHDLTVSYVAEISDSIQVDIIALQEIESTEHLNQVQFMLGDNWVSFRSGPTNSIWGELSYLINTENIQSFSSPQYINLGQIFYGREPYILEFIYNNMEFYLINIHLKCCDGYESTRRAASESLYAYIDTNLSDKNVIIVGDFNDTIYTSEGVFDIFLSNNEEYIFADEHIDEGSNLFWSYPGYPSHIDHIVISNELFEYNRNTITLLIHEGLGENGSNTYNTYISDHRPVGISLSLP